MRSFFFPFTLAALTTAALPLSVHAQDLSAGTSQIILEPKTSRADDQLKRLMKDFNATTLKQFTSGKTKVIVLPADKEADFLAKVAPANGVEYQVLTKNYTSFFQPLSQESLTDQQKVRVAQMKELGPTTLVSAPTDKFAKSALSKGLGKKDGLDNDNPLVFAFDNEMFTSLNPRRQTDSAGNITWFGSAKGEIGSAILQTTPDGFAGIIQKGQQSFLVLPQGKDLKGTRVHTATAIPVGDTPDHDPKSPPIPVGKKRNSVPATPGSVPTIRILFAYTPKAKEFLALFGPYSDISEFSTLLINQLNDRVYRSKAKLQYKKADAIEIDYDEKLEFHDLLKKLSDSATDGSGFLKNVHTARKKEKANIVAVMVRRGAGCGRAREIGASPETAMVVVVADWACTDRYSLAHEIGHLHGLVHDTNDQEPNQEKPQRPYAYGYRNDPIWRSIMAYSCRVGSASRECIRSFWTNPRMKCPDEPCEGTPFGDVNKHDEVRVLEETAPDLAKF